VAILMGHRCLTRGFVCPQLAVFARRPSIG
jgi:hypothetical protein